VRKLKGEENEQKASSRVRKRRKRNDKNKD
jgi:hypothetical protein